MHEVSVQSSLSFFSLYPPREEEEGIPENREERGGGGANPGKRGERRERGNGVGTGVPPLLFLQLTCFELKMHGSETNQR